jgi:geranylgeranyl diphosphate synthase type 3
VFFSPLLFPFPLLTTHSCSPSSSSSDVLQKRPTTPTLKIHTINYLKNQTKSFEYTLSVLTNLEAQTRAEIARLGGNRGLEAIMDLLHVDERQVT